MTFPMPVFSPVLGGVVSAVEWTAAATSATDATEYTFSSLALGDAAADRHNLVVVHGGFSTDRTLTATIAGAATSESVNVLTGSFNRTIFKTTTNPLTTGTTGNVVCTWNGGAVRCAVSVYKLTGISGAAPHDTGVNTGSAANSTRTTAAFDVPANGVVVAGGMSTTATATGWTNVDNDSQSAQFETVSHRTGSRAYASAQSGLQVVGTNLWHIGAASWGP